MSTARVETSPTGSDAGVLLLTASEYARYRGELEALRERSRDARASGAAGAMQFDDDHAVVLTRVAWLQDLLADATLVDDAAAADLVTIGGAVEVEYVRTARRRTYLVSGSAASGDPGTVSARSPVGRALMGRTTGDVVMVELPAGRLEELRVIAVVPSAGRTVEAA